MGSISTAPLSENMRQLTKYQIAVTSNKYIPKEKWVSDFGYLTDRIKTKCVNIVKREYKSCTRYC